MKTDESLGNKLDEATKRQLLEWYGLLAALLADEHRGVQVPTQCRADASPIMTRRCDAPMAP